jgi:transposase InsO family protein
VLRRLGKIKRRRPPVRLWTVDARPRIEVSAPNDLWTIDFKGWWRARNGDKCEPLTVRDACSRTVLAVALVTSTRANQVRRVLERLFAVHGVPTAMQCDNGSPFVCTRARGGLTKLSAWLVSLGIRLVRSRPGCPQDNGGHERMHRDLSELQLTPARSRRAQQRECDRWVIDFNHIRPHSAIGGKTPAEVYRNSTRRSLTPRVPSYPPEWKMRRVTAQGNVRVNGDVVFVSTALSGQLVGLYQESALRWRAHFFEVDLGSVEIVALNDAFTSDSAVKAVSAVNPQEDAPKRKIVNA